MAKRILRKMIFLIPRRLSRVRFLLVLVLADVASPMTFPVLPERIYHASKRAGFASSPNTATTQYPKMPRQYSNYQSTEFSNRLYTELPSPGNSIPRTGPIRTLRNNPTGSIAYSNEKYNTYIPRRDFQATSSPYPQLSKTQLPPPLETTKLLPPLMPKDQGPARIALNLPITNQSTTVKPLKVKSIKLELMSSMKGVLRNARKTSSKNSEKLSDRPKILEIQLPLKIASKDDLVAWARYVMGLMASKINVTLSTVKDAPVKNEKITTTEEPVNGAYLEGVDLRPSTFSSPSFTSDDFLQLPKMQLPLQNHPRRYPPFQTFSTATSNPFGGPNSFLDNNVITINNGLGALTRPNEALDLPAGAYLPSIPGTEFSYSHERPSSAGKLYNQMKPNSTRSSTASSVGSDDLSALRLNDIIQTAAKNQSNLRSALSLPFEAVITITRETPAESTSESDRQKSASLSLRDPPDEFPPYFDKNFTLTNEFGKINVVLEDYVPQSKSSKKKSVKLDDANHLNAELEDSDDEEEEDEKEDTSKEKDGKKKSKDKKKSDRVKKKKKGDSKKRQTSTLGELLMMLGLARKTPKNGTSSNNATPPILTILRGTGPQKVRLLPEHMTSTGRERRNETSQRQQFESDESDESDDSEDPTEGDEKDDERESDEEEGEDQYNDEQGNDEGGSLRDIIELLPILVPILEDVSDPNSETDLTEVIKAGLPLLQGLIEGDEYQDPVDIPGFIVPVLLDILQGKNGTGSNIISVIQPLLQLFAPLIGPIVGPLTAPFLRAISTPDEANGSSLRALVEAVVGPLSAPTGPYKQTPITTLLTGVVTSLVKETLSGNTGIDISLLLKNVISGVVAGTSAGLSGALNKHDGYGGGYGGAYGTGGSTYGGATGNKYGDLSPAPTSYAGYGGGGGYGVPANHVNPVQLIGTSIKDILGAGLTVASSLVTAVTGILGASSSSSKTYDGNYGSPPSSYGAPGSTGSSYQNDLKPPPQRQQSSPQNFKRNDERS